MSSFTIITLDCEDSPAEPALGHNSTRTFLFRPDKRRGHELPSIILFLWRKAKLLGDCQKRNARFKIWVRLRQSISGKLQTFSSCCSQAVTNAACCATSTTIIVSQIWKIFLFLRKTSTCTNQRRVGAEANGFGMSVPPHAHPEGHSEQNRKKSSEKNVLKRMIIASSRIANIYHSSGHSANKGCGKTTGRAEMSDRGESVNVLYIPNVLELFWVWNFASMNSQQQDVQGVVRTARHHR